MAANLSPDILRASQLQTAEFIEETPYCAIFSDMGFGKTASLLTAAEKLYRISDVKRMLVVSTLLVASNTWPEEIEDWQHTSYLTHKFIKGNDKQRREAIKSREDIHLINQENFVWLSYRLGNAWPYDMVVFDDAEGFKGHARTSPVKGTICTESNGCPLYDHEPRSKGCSVVCRYFKQRKPLYTRFGALCALKPKIKRLVHLTGTPTSKELLDLWPLIFTLDGGDRLGRTITKYRETYFTKKHSGFGYELRPGAEAEIHSAIADICISIESEAEIPEAHYINHEVTLPAAAQELYDELEREFYVEIGDKEIEAPNAGVLCGKLQQVSNGAIYDDQEDRTSWSHIHDAKIEALGELIAKHEGEPILVGYTFKHDRERLKRAFPHGVDVRDRSDAIKAWNAGEIPLMFAHPASAGHGLNLQRGPGRTLVWFGLNWRLDLVKQLNKRLHRPGQMREVYIYFLTAMDLIDYRIMETVKRKDASQQRLLDAVRMDVKKHIGLESF